MSTLDHNEPDDEKILGSHGPKEIDASTGYEQTDVKVTGIIVFLVSLLIFVGVCGGVTYIIGAIINGHLDREDGANTKWTKDSDREIRKLGNMPNNPELQDKIAAMTQNFPTPRVQTDDGNQDVAELHAREDLLLDNYSWIDQSKGTVRIPIERAMEIIAQKGLPVAAPVQEQAPLLAGDKKPILSVPLTSGFARTGYEQDLAAAQKAEEMQRESAGSATGGAGKSN
jgi:hypothetical protein